MNWISNIHRTLKGGAGQLRAGLWLNDRHKFEDRGHRSKTLACMLVGYKRALWPFVFPRFEAALPEGADVCLVSPGMFNEDIASLCREKGWSYLGTSTNDVSLAQNVCFRLHPEANMIVKLDEDMFLLPETITRTLRHYQDLKQEQIIDPGFVAPMIPLNGFCHRPLLERLDLLDQYEALFGPAQVATRGSISTDPQAARWIWQKTAPLAQTEARLSATAPETLLCSVQFNIGLIVFERSFWELMGYLPVSRRRIYMERNTLGDDERNICMWATAMSRPGVVYAGALAGHFAFGPQYAGMVELLEESPELFG
jgi:hypothetical protein